MKAVIEDIQADIRECAKEGGTVVIKHGRIPVVEIDIRRSRDESRRNNGGDYDFWNVYRLQDGIVEFHQESSCDFWQPDDAWSYESTDYTTNLLAYVRQEAQEAGVEVFELTPA